MAPRAQVQGLRSSAVEVLKLEHEVNGYLGVLRALTAGPCGRCGSGCKLLHALAPMAFEWVHGASGNRPGRHQPHQRSGQPGCAPLLQSAQLAL